MFYFKNTRVIAMFQKRFSVLSTSLHLGDLLSCGKIQLARTLYIFHERPRKNCLVFEHARESDAADALRRKEFWSAGKWLTAAKQTSTAVRVRKFKSWFCSFGLVLPFDLIFRNAKLTFLRKWWFWKKLISMLVTTL